MKSPFARLSALGGSSVALWVVTLLTSTLIVVAAPPGSPFNLGESLDPGCAPGDANCTVVAPAASGDNSDITTMDALTQVGIGTNSPGYSFHVSEPSTGSGIGTTYAGGVEINVNPSIDHVVGDKPRAFFGYSAIDASNTNAIEQVEGADFAAENYGTGSVEGLIGNLGWAYNYANSAINDLAAGWFGFGSDDGTIQTLQGIEVQSFLSGGTVEDYIGIHLYDLTPGTATITDRYGLLIDSFSGSTVGNDFGIYQAGSAQDNYFAGQVGIGTDTPSELLVLQGDDADADINLRVYEGGTTENPTIFFDFADGTSGAPTAVGTGQTVAHVVGRAWDGSAAFEEIAAMHFKTDDTTGVNDFPGRIEFYTATNNAGVNSALINRMEIDSDGEITLNPDTYGGDGEEFNIGEGEIEPGDESSDTAISMENSGFVYEIHVEDSDEFVIYEGNNEDSGNSVLMYNGSTDHWGFGTDPTADLIITSNGASLSAGGTWTDGSSRALKKDIEDLDLQRALETLMALDPVSFEYLNEPGEEYLGFIAEDVPDAVAHADRKGLSAMDFISVLTKVVQNQERRIQELESLLQ